MIYFLYGLDSFRLNTRTKELYKGVKDDDVNFDYICLTAPNFSNLDFINAVSSRSLLTSNKMVVIEDVLALGSKDLQVKIIDYLTNQHQEDWLLVFKENKDPDKRLKLFKVLNKYLVEQYEVLRPHQAREWLKHKAQELNIDLSVEASNILLGDFSQDLWRLNNELNKLANFADKQIITEDMVKAVVPQIINDNIFQTIDALAKRNIKLANRLISNQLSFGTSEQQLLAMVAYQFRNITLLKALTSKGIRTADLAKVSRLHPYVAQKTIGFTHSFSKSKLVKIFWVLNKIDMAIKTGKTPPRAGLDILVAQITSS